MRGSPIVQWLLFLLVWSALAIPIHRVTSSQTTGTEAAVQESNVNTWLSIRFSSSPVSFSVNQGGKELWREVAPKRMQFEKEIPIVFDKFGTELHLQADLPEHTSAVEIKLEPDAGIIQAQTVWVDGDLDELITFSWGRQ